MNKKTKLILSGAGVSAVVAIIPLAVVACSSTIAKVSTKNSDNLTDKGFSINVDPLDLTIKDIPLNGLPNNKGQSTLGELSKYINITSTVTGASLPDGTILSNISFTNGGEKSAAKISFSLGAEGSFDIIANQKGTITKNTTYNWTFIFPNLSTGEDLSNYLDGLQNGSLESSNIIIDSANSYNSFNPNGIQQYIWFNKLSEDGQIQHLGVLVGTWSNQNNDWEWVYNLNQNDQISPNYDLSASGVPSVVTSLDQLAKWIDFLPQLNQYSITKDAKVSVSLVSNNSQTITIDGINNNIEISGKFVNNSWVYSYVNKATVYAQMKNYINKINGLKLSVYSRSSSILPSQVSIENISKYISNLQIPPAGTTITYTLSPNDLTGELSIIVNISSKGQPTLSSEPQEVSGFSTTQELVQNYIDSINKTKLTLSSIASQNLPSQVSVENIATFINNLPVVPAGITLSYALKPNDTTGDLSITISASAQGATTVVASKQNLSGFLTIDQKVVNEYIALVNTATFSANEAGAKLLASSSEINNETLGNYLNGLPGVPKGIILSYKISTTNNGSISFTISASQDGATATSETKTANGFLTDQQQVVNNYIVLVNAATFSANEAGAKLLVGSSEITNENLNTYLNGLPGVPKGIILSYKISTTNNGSISFTISASQDGATATSEVKTANGFLTSQQQAVNNYINSLNIIKLTTTSLASQHLSSEVNSENIEQYINNLPQVPEGVTITYTFKSNDTTGLLDITISASAKDATTVVANEKSLSGFLTSQQQAVNNYIALVNAATFSANELGTKILANDSQITNISINTYLNGLPKIPNGITISFTITKIDSGSLSFTITAYQDQVSATSETKTANGFLTIQQQAVNNYIALVNAADISANSEGSQLLASDKSITNESLENYLNNLPVAPKGMTISLAIDSKSNGTISFSLSATEAGATATSNTKTAAGFLTSQQQALNNYIAEVNKATFSANQAGAKLLANDPLVTNGLIKNYLNGLPKTPEGISLSYTITQTANGSLNFDIIASQAGATATSESKTATGFLTTQQQAVDNYINDLNKIKLSATSIIDQHLASEVNEQNIDQYIGNLPHVPTGVTLTYNFKANDKSGDLSITISASSKDATTLVANEQIVSGFLTSQQQAVNNYIIEVNEAIINANAEGAKLFATNTDKVTNLNLNTLINGMPDNKAGISLTFNISTRANGTLTFSLIASLEGASATSEVKTVNGFLTNQQAVDQYINQVNATTISANAEGAKFLSNNSAITDKNLTNYLKDLPIPTNGISISFKIISTQNGGLTFSLSASLNNSTATSNEKIALGFLTTQQQTVNNYIKEVNGAKIIAKEEAKQLLTTNSIDVTNSNLSTLISGMPENIKDLTFTINIFSRDNGFLTFSVTATFEGASATSEVKTVNGFLTNQQALDDYIKQFNEANITINEAGKLLASVNTSEVTNDDLGTLINGVPATSQGISISFNILTRSDGALTFNAIAQVNGVSQNSDSKTVSGFLKVLNYIKDLDLKADANFAPPQNTSGYVSFANSSSIFANFNMTIEQIKKLASIENLYMKVSNSDLSQGSANLELFINKGNSYETAGEINYSGFYKGNSVGVQTSVENYFKDNNNVAKWLNIYLNINPSWLTTIFTNGSQSNNGAFFWGYNVALDSVSKIAFNDISVSDINNVITISAIMPNAISYEVWNSTTNEFVDNGLITKPNTKVSIQLPLIFQTKGNPEAVMVPTISTNSLGQTTINWPQNTKNGYGFSLQNYFMTIGNVWMPFRLGSSGKPSWIPIVVNSITF